MKRGSLWAARMHGVEETHCDESDAGQEQQGSAPGSQGSVWNSLPWGTARFHTEGI